MAFVKADEKRHSAILEFIDTLDNHTGPYITFVS
jgi:hypothetical protein